MELGHSNNPKGLLTLIPGAKLDGHRFEVTQHVLSNILYEKIIMVTVINLIKQDVNNAKKSCHLKNTTEIFENLKKNDIRIL